MTTKKETDHEKQLQTGSRLEASENENDHRQVPQEENQYYLKGIDPETP
jgi:hypothetical protein